MKGIIRKLTYFALVIYAIGLEEIAAIRVQPKQPSAYELPKPKPDEFIEEVMVQKIDHFAKGKDADKTFNQRYWLNTKFATQEFRYNDHTSDILFLKLCGEGLCDNTNGKMFPHAVGAYYNAMLASLEHRYYGKSHPFDALSTENMRYLNSQQALEDIKEFLLYLNTRHPFKKVLLIGCSYAGGLAGWFTENYSNDYSFPFKVAGWASSGVMRPLEQYWGYDEMIYIQAMRSGQDCVTTIQTINARAEAALTKGGADRDMVVSTLKADPGILNSDLMFFLADYFAVGIQYGNRTGLCSLMARIQDKPFHEQLQEIAIAADDDQVYMSDYDRNILKGESYTQDNSTRQWTYQYCNEFGWFPTPSTVSDSHVMRSHMLDLPYWYGLCHDLYGIDLTNSRVTNMQKIGASNNNGRVIYVNSVEDPWLGVSVLPSNKPESLWYLDMMGGPKFIEQGLDGPFQPWSGTNSLIMQCQNCAHCADVMKPKEKTDSQELKDSRDKILTWIHKYITEPY